MLVVGSLLLDILRRMLLQLLGLLLRLLLLLLLVLIILLLLGVFLRLKLGVVRVRARRRLGIKSLVLVGALLCLHLRLITLVLLLLLRLLLLGRDTLVMVGAIVVYPALGAVATAPFGVYSSEWGRILLLLRIGYKLLLGMLLVVNILRRWLRRVVFLLEERVQVVLVLLVRHCQMRTRALALIPLPSVQAFLTRRRVAVGLPVALADRGAPPDAVLALLLVAVLAGVVRETCDATAQRLLRLRRLFLLHVCA